MKRDEWYFGVRPDELVDIHEGGALPFHWTIAISLGSFGLSALLSYFTLEAHPVWLGVLGLCFVGTSGLLAHVGHREATRVRKITKRIMDRHDLKPLGPSKRRGS